MNPLEKKLRRGERDNRYAATVERESWRCRIVHIREKGSKTIKDDHAIICASRKLRAANLLHQ